MSVSSNGPMTSAADQTDKQQQKWPHHLKTQGMLARLIEVTTNWVMAAMPGHSTAAAAPAVVVVLSPTAAAFCLLHNLGATSSATTATTAAAPTEGTCTRNFIQCGSQPASQSVGRLVC